MFKKKQPEYMTSAELEEAIRRHREETKKLPAEARRRRVKAAKVVPVLQTETPPDGPYT
jgi:hypothetical protein